MGWPYEESSACDAENMVKFEKPDLEILING